MPPAQDVYQADVQRGGWPRRWAQAARLVESAMDHAPVGMALRPVDGPISRVNRAFAELVGRRPGSALG